MFLYSYQSPEKVKELLETGELKVTDKDLPFTLGATESNQWVNFEKPYRYIMDRMEKLVGPCPEGVRSPVWAWYRVNGRRKPTKRHDRDNSACLRIDFECDPRDALLTDFQMFCSVLYGEEYIAYSEDEDEEIRKKIRSMTIEEKYSYLDRMLEYNHKEDTWAYSKSSRNSVQATLYVLKLEMVRRITDVSGNIIYSSEKEA